MSSTIGKAGGGKSFVVKPPLSDAVKKGAPIGHDVETDEVTTPMRQMPKGGIEVTEEALDQIASGEHASVSTPSRGGGAKNIAAFFEFGMKDGANGGANIKRFGADVPLPTLDAVTGVVGTFSAAKVASLTTPTIKRTIPWNLERPMALRNTNPAALARTLAQSSGGASTFSEVATTILNATSGVDTSAMRLTKSDAAPKKKASESDYYDTPSFALFNSDYTMATRTKTGFDASGKPTDVELQVLGSSTFDANGIEMKGNAALAHDAPTMEEHRDLEQAMLNDNLVWGGEKKTLHPLKHFHDVISEKGQLAEGEPLQLQAMMHYRGESLSTTMTRESEPDALNRLVDSSNALLSAGGPEQALGKRFAAFATAVKSDASTSWQGLDELQATFDALKKDAALSTSPAASGSVTSAETLLFAAQERVFVPTSAGKDFKLSLQFSQVVDPGYWQSLAPEDKNPQHQVPDDKILWGWFRVSSDISGGLGAHVEQMRDAKTEVDQDRAGVILRALSDMGLPQSEVGLIRALESDANQLVGAVNARVQKEGGVVEKMRQDDIASIPPEMLTQDIAKRPPPKDATAQKMLAGAKAVLARHQALSIEIEQQVSKTASDALADVGITGGAFEVMPEAGSNFTEWSPRKDWYAHLIGDDH